MTYTRNTKAVGKSIAWDSLIVGNANNAEDARLWANAWKLVEALQGLLRENTSGAWDAARAAVNDAVGDEKTFMVKHRGSQAIVYIRLRRMHNKFWRIYRVDNDMLVNWQVTEGKQWGDESLARQWLHDRGWVIKALS